jgi:hypothetical protein
MDIPGLRSMNIGLGRPDLSGLSPMQTEKAKEILDNADLAEKRGLHSTAERLRAQVQTMVKRANVDLPPSSRERIKSQQAAVRMIKHQKK